MKKIIIEILENESSGLSLHKLKKHVIKKLSSQNNLDSDDKDSIDDKLQSAINSLISTEKLLLIDEDKYVIQKQLKRKNNENTDGIISNVSNKEKDANINKKKSKVKDTNKVKSSNYGIVIEELWKNGEKYWRENSFPMEYLQNNPDKITRLFCGNLSKKISEEELKSRLPGITYVKWITDKQSGEFYGSSFIEMRDSESAALAVLQDKSKFLGRPLKLYYCPPRPGDQWPPISGSNNSRALLSNNNNNPNNNTMNEPPRREKTVKPEGCKKLFAGNLSYNIDDDTIVDFFKECGTLVGLRWLTRKDTEEFRGAGYIEFATTEDAEAAMKLDGKELLGRNVRLDWTD